MVSIDKKVSVNSSEASRMGFAEIGLSALEQMQGEGVCCIFAGDSLLHLASFEALLLKLRDEGINAWGLVCNQVSGRRISQFDNGGIPSIGGPWVYLENGKDFCLQAGFSGKAQKLLGVITAFRKADIQKTSLPDAVLFAHPDIGSLNLDYWELLLSLGKPVTEILLEEGVGTYTQTSASWRKFSVAQLHNPVERVVKGFGYQILGRRLRELDKLRNQKVLLSRFCLFDRAEDNALIQNDVYRKYISMAFENMSERARIVPRDYGGQVLIAATNMFSECDDEDAELALLQEVVSLLSDKGLGVVLRPHPRDKRWQRYGMLDVEVDCNNNVPLESLLAVSKRPPVALIGFASSSEVLANCIWNIPCFSLTTMIQSGYGLRNSSAERKLLSFCHCAEELFCDRITTLESLDDLIGCLSEIPSQQSADEACK